MEPGELEHSECNKLEEAKAKILSIPPGQWTYYSVTLSLGEVAQGLETQKQGERFSIGATLILGQSAEYFVHLYREQEPQPEIVASGRVAQVLVAQVFTRHIAAEAERS